VTTTNPHLRTLLLAGAIAVVGAALAMFMLSRHSVGTSSALAPVVQAKHHVTPAAAAPAVTPTTAPTHARSVPPKTAAPPVRHAPLVDPVVRAALVIGLPSSVANAFAGHKVVVVSLYDPSSDVDGTSVAEARAGALSAGAAFVGIDTSHEGATGKLVRQLGVLRSPQTLVYAQPTLALVTRFDGFADRMTVAQAVSNADPGNAAGDIAQTAWARGADAVCDRTAAAYGALEVKTADQLNAHRPELLAIGNRFVADLAALPAPAGKSPEVVQFVAAETRNVVLKMQLTEASMHRNTTAYAITFAGRRAATSDVNTLALTLGATHCAGAV
jgi:hypothetical protein